MKKIFLLLFLMTISLGQSQTAAPGGAAGKNAWDVISLFSGAYTNVVAQNATIFNPNWGQASNYPSNMTTPAYGGDTVLQYQNSGNYQGTDTGVDINASAMQKLHLEIYSSTLTSITLHAITTTGGTVDKAKVLPLTTNTWNSFDLTLSTDFSGLDFSKFRQFKWDTPVGAGNIQNLIVDNIIFWRAATLPPPTIGSFSVGSKIVGDADSTITAPSSNNTSPFTYTSSNTAVATIVSGNQIHVVGAGTSTITASQITDGTWGPGSTTATLTVAFASPSTAATTPTVPSGNVISIYSDAYTATAGVTLNPNWGQTGFATANVTTYKAAGNNTLYYPNFNYQGNDFSGNPINLSTYNSAHLDVWSPNVSFLQFTLIPVTGVEKFVTIPVTPNSWNSVDILLSQYTAQNATILNSVKQIKYVFVNSVGAQQTGGVLYLDNVYFSNVVSNVNPLIYNFSVPSKLNGTANFNLTAPTSNSAGAWSYSSGNTAVATIVSGNQIHIVGAGTSVITATQAANGSYNSGSTTANFVVNAGATTAAPTPPARNSWDVISYYSDAFTAASTPTWGGQTAAVTIAGNNTTFMSDFMFGQIAFAANNVSAMSTLHIDIYSVDRDPLWVWVNSSKYVATTPVNGWTSLDIPLSSFVGLNAAAVNIIKIENPDGAGILRNAYVDNIYFYRAATTQPPSFGAFTVPAKLIGDADFAITAPTSTSTGAITYTSSNTAVATIVSGNQIHVVGAGTSTITATQAAVTGSYSSGTTTATFTVKYPAPTAGPTNPGTKNAWDVVSIYSAAYTPVTGTRNYNPDWGQSGRANFAQPVLGGDEVIKYSGVNYQGIVIGSNINVTGMTYVHIDIWTTDCASTDFRLIDTADRSKILTTPGGQWNSFDIPLTDFTSLNVASIKELKFQPNPFGGTAEWYIDNIYFWRAQTTPPPTLGAFTVPAKLTTDAPFTLTAPTSNTAGAWSYTSSNTAVATISGSTVTIKGNGTSTITATQAADGGYSSGVVTASLVVSFPPPTVAAPTPTVPSGNVISIFSNAYTDQAGTNFFPFWGQPTQVSEVTIAGNATKKYTSLSYEGTEFTTIDASSQYSIHFDLWSPNCTAIKISLISNTGGGEKAVVVPTTPLNAWKSVNLLMSQFSSQGLNLTGIFQIKIENWTNGSQTTGGELYIDNIYFSNQVISVSPIISGFTIPSKLFGDAPFALTAPTSTSAGAFTYTSSNTAIATVSGNTVTITGVGTAVITATQAANGSYTSGSTTANLVVTGPPTVAAPTPTKLDPQVKSIFSNSYVNLCTTSNDVYGGTSTSTDISINNNTTKKITNLGRLGYNLVGGGVDVSNMKTLHLDVFTPNVTKFNVILFNVAAQSLFPVTTTVNGWNSIDITLTGQTKVTQILLVASPDAINTIASTITNGVAYVDNIYFWTDVTNLSALSPKLRGITLSDVSNTLSAVAVSGATTYRYEITNKTTNAVSVLDRSDANKTLFSLIQFAAAPATNPQAITFGTTYSIRVAVDNSGYTYGTAYNVTTPVSLPTTKLANKYCGATISALNEPVYANSVYGATKYKFRVNGPGIVNEEKEVSGTGFNLTSLTGNPILYNTPYTIEVKASQDGTTYPSAYGTACVVNTPFTAPTSRIDPNTCGKTVSMASGIYPLAVYGADAYYFEVSGGNLGSPVGLEVTNLAAPAFKFNQITGAATNQTYSVRVSVRFNGVYPTTNGIDKLFGTSCTVSTGAARMSATDLGTMNLFNVSAFPNPFARHFSLNVESSSDELVELKVFDMIGRQLEVKKATVSELSTQEIGSNYPSGIYNIIVSQSENVKSLRMVKK